jgi:predicted alpha/beta hydrolase family esterase
MYTVGIMVKRALITYAWDKERGEHKWLFWLQKKLEALNFEVSMAPLAETHRKSHEVIHDLQSIYTIPDESVFFVQHDPGSLTILKYLEHLAQSGRTDTALLVAGIPIRAQGEPTHHLKLGTSGNIILKDDGKKMGENLDIKLVILYSADEEQLESGQRKMLY